MQYLVARKSGSQLRGVTRCATSPRGCFCCAVVGSLNWNNTVRLRHQGVCGANQEQEQKSKQALKTDIGNRSWLAPQHCCRSLHHIFPRGFQFVTPKGHNGIERIADRNLMMNH
jgi:hypothetical protein